LKQQSFILIKVRRLTRRFTCGSNDAILGMHQVVPFHKSFAYRW